MQEKKVMNRYTFYFEGRGVVIFAPDKEFAREIFKANFGEKREVAIREERPATKWERRQIFNTGAPSPKRKAK